VCKAGVYLKERTDGKLDCRDAEESGRRPECGGAGSPAWARRTARKSKLVGHARGRGHAWGQLAKWPAQAAVGTCGGTTRNTAIDAPFQKRFFMNHI
jgi:hypothetical protein